MGSNVSCSNGFCYATTTDLCTTVGTVMDDTTTDAIRTTITTATTTIIHNCHEKIYKAAVFCVSEKVVRRSSSLFCVSSSYNHIMVKAVYIVERFGCVVWLRDERSLS